MLTQDPIGLAGGVNLYAYAGNNPIAWSDPFGLDTLETQGFRGGRSDPQQKALADQYVAACEATGPECTAMVTAMRADTTRYVLRVTDAPTGGDGGTTARGRDGKIYMFVNPGEFAAGQANRVQAFGAGHVLAGPATGAFVAGHEFAHGLGKPTFSNPMGACGEACAQASETRIRIQSAVGSAIKGILGL